MFGIGKKKEPKDTRIINPELGIWPKIIGGIAVLIFLPGLYGGAIGGAIMGALAYGFYYVAIRQVAKFKHVDAFVEPTKEQLEQIEEGTRVDVEKKKAQNKRLMKILKYSLILFAVVFGFIFIVTSLG